MARPHDAAEGLVPGVARMHGVDDCPEARTVLGLPVHRCDSPLFFADAENLRRRAPAAVGEQDGPVRRFVLNAESDVEAGITAFGAVDTLCREPARRGAVFARVEQDLRNGLNV